MSPSESDLGSAVPGLVGAPQALRRLSRLRTCGCGVMAIRCFCNENLGQGEFAKEWQIP